MYIKICGMTNEGDIDYCARLGTDAVGIVVEYPVPVPWNLSRTEGHKLRLAAPPTLGVVMVCSGKPDDIERLVEHVQPTAVQLHGNESIDETAALAERLRPAGIPLYRALRVHPGTGRAAGELPDPVAAARALAETGIAGLVVDSQSPHRPGGTGVPLDLATVQAIKGAVSLPIIVAGGLTAPSVGRVIASLQPYGVDVLTGVESAPRVKDRQLIAAFCTAARSAAKGIAAAQEKSSKKRPQT